MLPLSCCGVYGVQHTFVLVSLRGQLRPIRYGRLPAPGAEASAEHPGRYELCRAVRLHIHAGPRPGLGVGRLARVGIRWAYSGDVPVPLRRAGAHGVLDTPVRHLHGRRGAGRHRVFCGKQCPVRCGRWNLVEVQGCKRFYQSFRLAGSRRRS